MADNFLKKTQYTKMESQRCNIILYWNLMSEAEMLCHKFSIEHR
jgi:hypothetical protein